MEKSKAPVLFAFILATSLAVAYMIRGSLLIIYISCIFAIVLSSSVRWVCRLRIGRWRPNRGAAILLIIIAVLLAFTILFVFGLPPVINDLQQVFTKLPEELPRFRERMKHVPILNRLDESRIQEYSAAAMAAIPQVVGSIANGIASIAGVVVLTAYLILEGGSVFAWFLAFFPAETRPRLRLALVKAAGRMRRWLVGQALLMLILGSASTIVFGLLGIRYFYLLGVFAGVANFIPLLGPILTVILAGLVAALDSWGKLLGVLIFYMVYQQIENAYLTPRIMEAQVQLSPSAVLVSLLIGAELAGIPGAMMAVPTAVLISVLVDAFIISRNPESGSEPASIKS